MVIDIRTLIIVLGFTHLMQFLVFYHQYRVNKTYKGIGWWLLWSAAEVIGFGAMLLRGSSIPIPIIIIVQNSMIVAGTVFLYIGIRRFFDKTANMKIMLPIVLIFIMGLLFFLFVINDIQIRSAFISATLAIISFITAYSLFTDKPKSIRAAVNFNAIIGLVHGGVFLYRLIMIITGTPADNIFSTDFFNLLTYFDALIVSLLWTFGLIIMLNQRLNTDIQETKNQLQLIFNTSPDAAMITRLEDGLIVDINEGFSAISGYSRNEVIGKSTSEVNIWKNIEDRQEVITLLKKQGFCENYEALLVLKGGVEITGLVSAKIINLNGTPHIISISRNISERIRMEKELHESELLFRLLFENMNEGVALHEMIYDEKGAPIDYRIVEVNEAFEKQTGIPTLTARSKLASILYSVENLPYLTEYNEVVQSGKPISFETHLPILNKFFSISAIATKPGYFATIFQDITDRKQKEDEIQILLEKTERSRNDLLSILEDQMISQKSLKVSEERYRSLLTNLEAGVVVHASDTSIIMNNNRAAILLGLSDDQIKGKLANDTQWKFINENNIVLQIEEYPVNKILATKKSFNNFILGVVLPTNKEITWLTVNGFPVVDNNYNITEILISFIDITERKKAEVLLRESEIKFRQTFELSPLGIVMVGLDKRFINCNNAFSNSLGYPTHEVIGKTIDDLTFPEDRHLGMAEMMAVSKGELEVSHVQKRYLRKDGMAIWGEVTISLIRNLDGNPQYFLAIIQDITERLQSEKALRDSEDKFKYVFDHSVIGKSILLPTGEIHVNKAFCEITGYSSEELQTKKWQEISHPDDIEQSEKEIQSLLSGENNSVRFTKRYIHKNGSVIWTDLGTVIRRDEKGKLLYFITAINDITDRKRAEDEVKKLNEELEQRVIQRTAQLEAANKELEAFSYSVSHDLRAPLRHVNGYVELLSRHFNSILPEKGKHFLDSITIAVNSMGVLIDDLLQFSRMGRKDMSHMKIDMKSMVMEVKEFVCNDHPKRKIEWVIGELPSVYGDRAMFQQVWVNLINNAVKFTGTRKKTRIEIGVREEKKEWVFFVGDNGVGFDMQYAHKLFGVFQRLHPSDEFEGTGIGLANVRRIVLRHQGNTWAEGEIDKGAKIFFSIPKQRIGFRD